ncbi:MAG: hypothetical protein ACK5HB_08095 [Ignavibacteria bacterium]|jgi:hypothetical protein
MKLKYNFIFSLQLLILFASTFLTGYSQSTLMKFMGFSMGMRSNEVISKLLAQDEITAYAHGGNQLTRNDRVELFKNTDTLLPYHENRYKFNCPSYLLGTPSTINYHGYQEFTHFQLVKLIFNQYVINNPSFVFEEDTLVGMTGNFNILYSEYNELVTGLEKKYGKGVYNNYLTTWMKDGNVITLYAPIYEQWIRNKKIKVHDNQYKSTNTIFYQFNNLNRVRECKQNINLQYKEEEEKFITINDNKIYLLGLATGTTKEDVFTFLSQRYKDLDIRTDANSFLSIRNGNTSLYSNHGYAIIRDVKDLPDSFSIDVSYKDYIINCRLTFLYKQLFSISLSCNIQSHPTEREFYNVIKRFTNAKRLKPHTIHNERVYIWDELFLSHGHDSLYMRDNYSFGYPTQIILKNNYLQNKKTSDDNILLNNAIHELLDGLGIGRMLDFQLNTDLQYNRAQPIPSDYRKQWINISQNRGSYTTYEYDVSYRNERIITDGTLGELKGDSYCCYADMIQLYIREGKICSISSGIRPLFYNTGQQLQKVKADILKEMIKQLSSKYGEAIERSYAGRKSLYWIIDTYIFELILESKQSLYSTGSFNETFAVFFSLRIKDDDDLILKSSSKKGILD